MKKLSINSFEEITKYINGNARSIEKAVFNFNFGGGEEDQVLSALSVFQNEDGGFGNAIEPDFRLVESSPMGTATALKYLSQLEGEEAKMMIVNVIKYLENSFDKKKKRWYSVPEKVNNYPHAPWWEYEKDISMTVIDYSWGNPTAELIGYLYKYREYVRNLDVDYLINLAIEKLVNKDEYNEHEIYSYIKLYNILDQKRALKLEKTIVKAVNELVNRDIDEWDQYVPSPIKFICKDSISCFKIGRKLIEKNADFLIHKLEKDNKINTSWAWDDYLSDWEKAKKEWEGILTLDALVMLNKLDKLEK